MKKKTYVVGKTEHDFGCPVPPGRHVFGHEALVSGSLGGSASRSVASREPEVADFEFAVGIHEEISRLEIPMKHVGGMDVFQAAESLV